MERQTNKGGETSAVEKPHVLTCASCNSPLQTSEDEHALRCTLCGQGHKFLDPPSTETRRAYNLGDAVAVLNGGRWWSAHVVESAGTDRWMIHYEGWAPNWDEIIGEHRIRPLDYKPGSSIIPPPPDLPPTKVKRGNSLFPFAVVAVVLGAGIIFYVASMRPPGDAAQRARIQQSSLMGPLGGPVNMGKQIESGQKYFVKWGSAWYMGTVMSVQENGLILIHYDGWDSSEDEFVIRDRLREIE